MPSITRAGASHLMTSVLPIPQRGRQEGHSLEVLGPSLEDVVGAGGPTDSWSDHARGWPRQCSGAFLKVVPAPIQGKSSVLGPHWPDVLRMTRGRCINRAGGKDSQTTTPEHPAYHEGHSHP